MGVDKEREKARLALQDADGYLEQIRGLVKTYRRLVGKLEAMQREPKKHTAGERDDLLMERDELKRTFIAKKQAARAVLALVTDGSGVLKEKELKELQEAYRDADKDFKALGLQMDRAALLQGTAASGSAASGEGVPPQGNTATLERAAAINDVTTARLKEGLAVVISTTDVAQETAATLAADREKISRISAGLDEIDSELAISKKLITRFVKRLYTDKIIIAFTFLIVVALVGIIVYATVNPGQSTFNVPDVVKPPLPESMQVQQEAPAEAAAAASSGSGDSGWTRPSRFSGGGPRSLWG